MLQAIGQLGLTHGKEVSKVTPRLFPMTTKGKAFRAARRHPNPKSTKKRIETSSVWRGHIASQCPNKQTMVAREHGEIETASEDSDHDDEEIPQLEDCSDD